MRRLLASIFQSRTVPRQTFRADLPFGEKRIKNVPIRQNMSETAPKYFSTRIELAMLISPPGSQNCEIWVKYFEGQKIFLNAKAIRPKLPSREKNNNFKNLINFTYRVYIKLLDFRGLLENLEL